MAQEKFCKKVLRITCAINKVAELEMGKESSRVKRSLAARYWCRVRQIGKEVQASHTSDKKRILNLEVGP
jgi:hypothetical protein